MRTKKKEPFRLAVDTGGTFTDLLIEDAGGTLRMYKASTTPDDPVEGVLNTLELAATDLRITLAELLGRSDLFIHGTTRAINAIVTGTTARTAFLTTKGHPDILVFREGGRIEPFNFTVPFPRPYVPRALTFEIPERIGPDRSVIVPLDESAVLRVIEMLRAKSVEAVAVCLLWSIVNPRHELRMGELLAEHLPGIPYTLSHRLNPTIREYRRASATCIDASLKPVMDGYLHSLADRVRTAGFRGRLLMVTSQGNVMDAANLAETPIRAINSGPAMAPIAGLVHVRANGDSETAIVTDAGGTTYDVSVVRHGRIPWTREAWLGQPYRGHMTGFPSVDVRSIGAGGGSIAWVDVGGMLHVGPQSAGAVPGPVCYGRGGTKPTVTDAALALGYLDPEFFLGGALSLDPTSAEVAITRDVGGPLGLDLYESASAVLNLATERMVTAIEEITVNQGIDPRTAVLVGGGGAAGFNASAVARRLGCPRVIIPEVGAALSAAGGLMSDLGTEFRKMWFTTTDSFDRTGVNAILDELEAQCHDFAVRSGASVEPRIAFSAEARYPHQIWEIEVPMHVSRFAGSPDVDCFIEDFHVAHEEIFAIRDAGSAIEIIGWRAHVQCRLPAPQIQALHAWRKRPLTKTARVAYFPGHGLCETPVHFFEQMNPGVSRRGPAIVESSFTTIVIDPGDWFESTAAGSLIVVPAENGTQPEREEAWG